MATGKLKINCRKCVTLQNKITRLERAVRSRTKAVNDYFKQWCEMDDHTETLYRRIEELEKQVKIPLSPDGCVRE